MATANKIILDPNQGISYELPPIPSDEKEILFFDKKKADQFWITPQILPVKKMTERERIEYIEMWRRRWVDGMWFFNNGEPTYINGLMVDHLVFNTFNSRKFVYLESQRDDFLFRELVLKNDDWDGSVFVKPRRYGATAEEITVAIYVILSGFYHHVAIQSDTLDKAKSTILTPLIDSYISRPEWMREFFYKSNGKVPINELKLRNVVSDDDPENTWLGGIVKAYPTSSKSLDGKEFMYVIMDEFSKWPTETNPRDTLEINMKTVRNFGRIGKVSCLSTTGDSDNVIQSTKEWVKLVGDSTIIPGKQKTNSGLIKRFVSAIHSKYLDPKFTDKYGQVNKEAAEEEVHSIINKKQKGTKDYYFEKRKLPLTEDEALIAATEASYFPKIKLISRRKELESLPNDEKPYVRGILEETSSGKIYFKSDTERAKEAAENGKDIEAGMWMIAVHPYFSAEQNIDTRNRYKKTKDGVFFPVINPEFVIGYDPIRYRKEDTKSQSLSRASIIVHKVYDYYKSGICDVKAALFLGRPNDPKDAHREAIKACKYFGAPCMHERNIESVKEVFEDGNMLPFLLKSEKDGLYGIYTDSSGKIVKNGIDMLVARYSTPKFEGETDQIAVYPFEDGLIDLENFDIANTNSFDVAMSEIMLEYGIKQTKFTNLQDYNTNNTMKFFNELIAPRR